MEKQSRMVPPSNNRDFKSTNQHCEMYFLLKNGFTVALFVITIINNSGKNDFMIFVEITCFRVILERKAGRNGFMQIEFNC